MKSVWHAGNRVELLENGEQFYPEVLRAIGLAREEVLIETYILFDDAVGRALQQALISAAKRGVSVDITIDSYGSPDLCEVFLGELTASGARLHLFDHQPKILGLLRPNLLRRLHRKLVVIDQERAFIGGINFSADHLMAFGPEAKQDFAVSVIGPVVGSARALCRDLLDAGARAEGALAPKQACEELSVPLAHLLGPSSGPGSIAGQGPSGVSAARWKAQAQELSGAALEAWERGLSSALRWRPSRAGAPLASSSGGLARVIARDNGPHRREIEREYRRALRAATSSVVLANAYFFPGYRLLRAMRKAALRGVRVSLILQGKADLAIAPLAARLLYASLQGAGVSVFEYTARPLHAKVAVVDDAWATVGSSNLDPLSLALNLEANLFIRDPAFAGALGARLRRMIAEDCELAAPARRVGRPRAFLNALALFALQRLSATLAALPSRAHKIALSRVLPPKPGEAAPTGSGR